MNENRFKYFLYKSLGGVVLLSGIFIYYETRSIVSMIITIIAFGLIIFGGYYKEKNIDVKPNTEKDHYNTLISLYKYTGGIVALLVGLGAWIIGGNINEIKESATNEINSYRDDLTNIKTESKAAIDQSQLAADKQIDDIRNNMKLFLDLTKDITSIQIETIREDARNLALSSARSRIEEVFKSTNLQREIDSTARQHFGEKLEDIVKTEMEKSTEIFEDLPIITGLSGRLSTVSFFIEDEDRKPLDQLDSISQFAKNLTIRKVAQKALLDKGDEFEKGIDKQLMTEFQLSIFNPDSIYSITDSIRIKGQLIDSIFTVNGVWKVSYAFVILRYFSGITLNNFDFTAVRKMKEKLNAIRKKS